SARWTTLRSIRSSRRLSTGTNLKCATSQTTSYSSFDMRDCPSSSLIRSVFIAMRKAMYSCTHRNSMSPTSSKNRSTTGFNRRRVRQSRIKKIRAMNPVRSDPFNHLYHFCLVYALPPPQTPILG
ncbi:hypothetical protein PFISCL1PPCAC_6526, partial [Pristionchus fissidentatus]